VYPPGNDIESRLDCPRSGHWAVRALASSQAMDRRPDASAGPEFEILVKPKAVQASRG
jgi:hypothetical protein